MWWAMVGPIVPLLVSAEGGVLHRVDGVTARLAPDFAPVEMVLVPAHRPWAKTIEAMLEELAEAGVQTLLVPTRDDPELATELSKRHGVEVLDHVVDSPWLRDFGPLRVDDGPRRIFVDARTHPDLRGDETFARVVAQRLQTDSIDLPHWLEGGGFASNGSGLCVTASGYLELRKIGPRERELVQRTLGCPRLVVLPVPTSEPTRHVDLVVQFTANAHALVATAEGEHGRTLALAAAMLRAAGHDLELPIDLTDVPSTITDQGAIRSGVNALQLGDRLFVPRFAGEDPGDAIRLALPDRVVASIDADQPIAEGGALHCLALGL